MRWNLELFKPLSSHQLDLVADLSQLYVQPVAPAEELQHRFFPYAHPGKFKRRRSEGIVDGIERKGLVVHPPYGGVTQVDLPVGLPARPARILAYAALRESTCSNGVTFSVCVNGMELAHEKMLPGNWREISCDLSRWAGKSVVLALTIDADGSNGCDWAFWGEPSLCFIDE